MAHARRKAGNIGWPPNPKRPHTSRLRVQAARAPDDLTWNAIHTSDRPVWAVLRMPMLKNGALSFAEDSESLKSARDGTLLVRAIDIPICDHVDVDRLPRSGGVRQQPDVSRHGCLRLDAHVTQRTPNRSSQSRRITVRAIVSELGGLPQSRTAQPSCDEKMDTRSYPGSPRLIRLGSASPDRRF